VPAEAFYARSNPKLKPAGPPFTRGQYVIGLRKDELALTQKKDKEFTSYYKPWQEVCLIGVDPATLPPGVTSQELVVPTPDSAAADAPPATTPPPTTTP